MLKVTDQITLDESLIEFQFIRSGGPGGQNVNKVATTAQLRFNLESAALPPEVRQRLIRLAGKRVSQEGILILTGRRFRTQERNREDVIDRLLRLVRQAAVPPRKRRATKPSASSVRKRLEHKRHTASKKRERKDQFDD
ncbi:MAG: aminoacyl-tRNA hydrolase [Acidobacteria bacterium]|nr:MAG: aminoacyl-tRNA hydrolase [Acidobacteriota bacterium]